MLESSTRTHSIDKVSIPGKVFLMGEYAVLKGAPAWVASIQPRFEWSKSQRTPLDDSFFPHPQSPAGRYLDSLGLWTKTGGWYDPFDGLGGFGGSTAEFLAALFSRVDLPVDTKECHRLYQSFSKTDDGYIPSGADLIAQKVGGIVQVQNINTNQDIEFQNVTLPAGAHWLVFSASHLPGRKTKTHSHLASKMKFDLEPLIGILNEFDSALSRQDPTAMGKLMIRYSEALNHMGLENPDTEADRMELCKHPDVLGVKGCGANLSDAVLVLLKSVDHEEQVVQLAKTRGLQLVTRYLGAEGVSRV